MFHQHNHLDLLKKKNNYWKQSQTWKLIIIKKKKKTEKGIFDSKFSNEMQGELCNDSFAVTATSNAYRICPISQMNAKWGTKNKST